MFSRARAFHENMKHAIHAKIFPIFCIICRSYCKHFCAKTGKRYRRTAKVDIEDKYFHLFLIKLTFFLIFFMLSNFCDA